MVSGTGSSNQKRSVLIEPNAVHVVVERTVEGNAHRCAPTYRKPHNSNRSPDGLGDESLGLGGGVLVVVGTQL